ncbi:MAG: hypothetical protein PHE02_06105 [Lachnospiraceae bacterium]|nr:hypothetical protein [Lachnospiraceae bacterium]
MRKKRDWKQIRNAFVMVCVAVAMLSTATYAWFTLTNQPYVTGMDLTASTTGGLQVGKDSSGPFSDKLELTDGNKKLSPVLGGTNGAFTKPVYTGNAVNSTEEIPEGLLYTEYVAHYVYHLHALGDTTTTLSVRLRGGDKTEGAAGGSYIIRNDKHKATTNAENAIRVGFKIGSVWKVYEPNTDGSNTGTNAVNGVTEPTSDFKQNSSGIFTSGGSGIVSNELCTIAGGNTVQVDMYVWIEGTDKDCMNEIQTDQLKGQIQFTTEATTTTP